MRVGIDNGLSGGIVGIDASYQTVVAERMPIVKARKKRVDVAALVKLFGAFPPTVYVVLEYAQPFPAQGGVSGFTTGENYGAIKALLLSMGIPHEIRKPKAWMKVMGIVSPAAKDPARKAKIKAQTVEVCRRRLPSLDLMPGRCTTPQDGLADAGCMALDAASLRPFAVAPSQGSLL